MRKVRVNRTDDPTETRARTRADRFAGPNEHFKIPEPAGVGQFDDNAKMIQRASDHPKMKAVLQGHITVNEMEDQADDNTNFLGYCNDN